MGGLARRRRLLAITIVAGSIVLGASANADLLEAGRVLAAAARVGAVAEPPYPAAVFTVTAADDADDGSCSGYPGHCSLREAINAANAAPGADTVDFHATVVGTISLATPLPHLADNVTILGPGAAVVTVDANSTGSTLWIDSGVTASVSALGLTDGIGSGAGGSAGGGVWNEGTLTLSAMLIFANSAQVGGGVAMDSGADLVLMDSTLRGNSAFNFGGAVYTVGGGTVVSISGTTISGNSSGSGNIQAPAGTSFTISNSTISGNTATQTGGIGGIWSGINTQINNSTIVGNTGIGVFGTYLRNSIVDSCGSGGGIVGSLGHNLAPSSACFFAAGPGDVFNPSFLLGPLQNNGGPTDTHALLPGSPAIGSGDNATCAATDQRGYPRPFGSNCDTGAYEYRATQPPTPTQPTPPAPTASPTPGCVPPPGGMVAWYPLDELMGATVVNDVAPPPASVVNNSGVTMPGPLGPISSTTGPFPVMGKVAGAHYFWGPSPNAHYHEVAPSPELDFGTGDFSIDAWIRDVGNGQKQAIVDKLDIPGGNVGFALYIEGWLVRLHLNGSTHASVGAISHGNPLANTGPWYHVAATVSRSTGTGTLYIDGAPAGPTFVPSNASVDNLLPLWIGETRLPINPGEIAIDELEIFNRAITPAEVNAIYAAGQSGKCRPGAPTPTATRTPPQPDITSTPTRTPGPIWPVYLGSVLMHGQLGSLPTPPPRTATPDLRTASPTATMTQRPSETPTPRVSPTPTTEPTWTPSATATATRTDQTPSMTPSATATNTPHQGTVATPTPTITNTPRPTVPTATPTSTVPTPTPTSTPGCAPQPADMAAWWPLDELTGTTAWDVIGGNHGDVQGGATVANPAKVAAGRRFDGSTGLVVVPHSPSLDPGTADFSIDAWINPETDAFLPIVTKKYAPADVILGWYFAMENRQLVFGVSTEDSGFGASAPNPLALDGQWHLVAVTIERGSTTGGHLYIDGALAHTFDTTQLVGPADTTAELHIGEQPSLGRGQAPRYFQGGIDELEIFHRELSAGEVLAIYNAGAFGKCDKPGPPQPTDVPDRRSVQSAARVAPHDADAERKPPEVRRAGRYSASTVGSDTSLMRTLSIPD
jgi:CSLREA domain-containing protein